jgi:hypothetical protein
MIVILKRSDLKVEGMPAKQIRLHHTLLPPEIIEIADLILLTEINSVFVLYAKNWPMKKPMSPAEMFRYIAEHAAIEYDHYRQPGRPT